MLETAVSTLRAAAAVGFGLILGACLSGSGGGSTEVGQVSSALGGSDGGGDGNTTTCTPSMPCSIWSTSTTPTGADNTTAVELGVKVQSAEAGYITGVRFYKDDSASTHTVSLWDASGDLLASATTTSETSSGWQAATFAGAVSVGPGTTYVGSYFMPGGYFALDRPGFTSAVVNGPLEALADGQDGGNGVYAYGASSSFPSNSFAASNYWVDILFSTSASPPPCTPSTPCSIWSTSATPAGS